MQFSSVLACSLLLSTNSKYGAKIVCITISQYSSLIVQAKISLLIIKFLLVKKPIMTYKLDILNLIYTMLRGRSQETQKQNNFQETDFIKSKQNSLLIEIFIIS